MSVKVLQHWAQVQQGPRHLAERRVVSAAGNGSRNNLLGRRQRQCGNVAGSRTGRATPVENGRQWTQSGKRLR